MGVISRPAYVVAGSIVLGGCISTATAISDTQRLVSAEPIQTEFIVATSTGGQQTWSPAGVDGHEKAYLGYVLLDSGRKCQAFADRLSVAQRGVDTSFDILTGILSALATALTPIATIHALTAAATISSGTKTAIDANVYAKATAALILQEINRTYYLHINNYRNEILATQDIVPTIEVSRIEAIHRECSLDFAVASLSQTGAAAAASIGAASGAVAGAAAARQKGLSPEAGAIVGAAAGAAAGGAAGTPQTAANAGAAAGMNIGTAPREPGGTVLPPPIPIAPPPNPPPRRPPPVPACQASGPSIPLACPPLAPELQSRRKEVSDAVKKLKNLAKLQAVARTLGVSTPVPTVRCIQRDIVNHIEQICTDDKLQEMNRALADPGLMR